MCRQRLLQQQAPVCSLYRLWAHGLCCLGIPQPWADTTEASPLGSTGQIPPTACFCESCWNTAPRTSSCGLCCLHAARAEPHVCPCPPHVCPWPPHVCPWPLQESGPWTRTGALTCLGGVENSPRSICTRKKQDAAPCVSFHL